MDISRQDRLSWLIADDFKGFSKKRLRLTFGFDEAMESNSVSRAANSRRTQSLILAVLIHEIVYSK